MKNWVKVAALVTLGVMLSLTACTKPVAKGLAPTEFYKGQTIRFLCPYNPGGGFDTTMRIVGTWLEKYTGGHVVVENMPGAAGLVAINYAYNKAEREGLTVTSQCPYTIALNQAVGAPDCQFDVTKFKYLGGYSRVQLVFAVGGKSPFKTLGELIAAKRTITIATDSRMSGGYLVDALLLPALGVSVKPIFGYKSSAETLTAAMRGEVDAVCSSYHGSVAPINEGSIRGLFVTDKERLKDLPGVPTIYESASLKGEAGDWLEWIMQTIECNKVLMTPPGVPEARIVFLRSALDKAFKQEGLLTDLKRAGTEELTYFTGKEVEKLIAETMSLSAQRLELLKKAVQE